MRSVTRTASRRELLEIKNQLVKGQLLESQRLSLIEAITRYENGDPWELIFPIDDAPQKPLGKKSVAYRHAVWVRNVRMLIASTYFDGSDWIRCQQLAELSNRVTREMNAGRFLAKTEPERVLERIKKSGVKMLTTTRSIHRVLFTDKSTPF